jgi:DNA helicase HerA-like ATPase
VTARVQDYALPEQGFTFQSFPVQFWDLFGSSGTPVRATIADLGPLLLGRLLALNDTQSAVLTVVFKIAADEKLELTDLKDLRKTLEYAGNNAPRLSSAYGNLATASIGSIQRGLIALEQDGMDRFFGEPSLIIKDLLRVENGKGVINILASDRLMLSPKTYSAFLLWLLSKLFTTLPEIGDVDKPKLIFFFDEAHLLFSDAPKALLEKVEQVVRLIRSNGVGVYFISQNPSDIPDTVLGQLSNKIQHALRAYTPKDQKALKAAAASFRANPAFDSQKAIAELGTGEALISFLDAGGTPNPVERAFILPPQGQIGPLDAGERARIIAASLLQRVYAQAQDRESAYELLQERQKNTSDEKALAAQKKEEDKLRAEQEKIAHKEAQTQKAAAKATRDMVGSVVKSVGKPLLREFIKGLFKR